VTQVVARRRTSTLAPIAIAIAWALAIAAQATGHGRALHHDALIHSGVPLWAALVLFVVAWQAMIAAMMLPSSLPLIRLYAKVSAPAPSAAASRAAFLGGYTTVWTAFGVVAFLGDVGVHRVVERWGWLAARPWVIGGSALVVAGAFQFSDLKDRCLTVCRNPGQFIFTRYRRGMGEAYRLGRSHGLFCLGCCWALMLVAFAAGVANLWWMAALTAFMVFERRARDAPALVTSIGVGLILLGAFALVPPHLTAPLLGG
jgi:predicted metal-binding membrane protein